MIDGMAIAMDLYHNGITPGEYVYSLLSKGKNTFLLFIVRICWANLTEYGIINVLIILIY